MKSRIQEMIARLIHTWSVKRTLLLILAVGLLHGVIYVFAIPPWWHYDEAGHFEYAWLIANRPTWPKDGTFDEGLQRKIAASMLESGWYRTQNYTPDLSSDAPVWIGNITAAEPPAFYIIPSLEIRLLNHASVDIQLYSMRLFSVGLFLLTLFLAWKMMGELFGQDHPLTWMVPLFMALLPGLVDIMTSANNDAGAVASLTVFLWFSICFVKRRFSFLNLLWLILATLLCYLTKRTTLVAIGLFPIVVLLSIVRGRGRKFVWATMAIAGIAGLFLVLRWGDAAAWYQVSDLPELTRAAVSDAPGGKYVFQVSADGSTIGQFIDPATANGLRGEVVTLGVWMWADRPIEAKLPTIRFAPAKSGTSFLDSYSEPVQLSTKPAFFTVETTVPDSANRGWIMVSPGEWGVEDPSYDLTTVFFDGFTLAQGEFISAAPVFIDAGDRKGTWDGKSIENLVRNGSAESGWLTTRAWLTKLTRNFGALNGRVQLIIASIQDWHGVGWFYTQTAGQLSNTFWSQVATNKVRLPGGYTQDVLRFIFLVSIAGALIWGWRERVHLPWEAIFIMAVAGLVTWGLDFLRGSSELLQPISTLPWARYGMPAIIPVAVLLCAGWLELLRLLRKLSGISQFAVYAVLPVFMLGLDLYTFFAMIEYFYPNLLNLCYLIIFIGVPIFIFMGLQLSRRQLDPIQDK